MNRHVFWAFEPTQVASRLDDKSIIKINSYLKYLSESDDLWINPTPLDERDPIKISAAINKPTHMKFGPSCQFNTSLGQIFIWGYYSGISAGFRASLRVYCRSSQIFHIA